MEGFSFSKIAPYLKDPLVLIGFFIFLAFLFIRYLVKAGVIPILDKVRGFNVLKTILLYGFIIGILITLLGFGLKYRELNEKEQGNVVGLISNELSANKQVIGELKANTRTLSNAAEELFKILRIEKIKIMFLVFPKENIDTNIDQSNLYNVRMDLLEESNLLKDTAEVRRFNQVCNAINKTIKNVQSTILSLSDIDGKRYVIETKQLDGNIEVLRKINIVDISSISTLYSQMKEARTIYNRITQIVVEYTNKINLFCETGLPTRNSLSAALATERLTFSLLVSYKEKLSLLLNEIDDEITRLNIK